MGVLCPPMHKRLKFFGCTTGPLTRAIPWCFRDEFLTIKRHTNLRLLYFNRASCLGLLGGPQHGMGRLKENVQDNCSTFYRPAERCVSDAVETVPQLSCADCHVMGSSQLDRQKQNIDTVMGSTTPHHNHFTALFLRPPG